MQKQTQVLTRSNASTYSDASYYGFSSIATVIGAWVLTGAALLASTESLHHANDHAVVPVTVGTGHSLSQGMTARAEGVRETARMLEEYDVGLRMPHISGS